MRSGQISIVIILFYLGNILYEIFVPSLSYFEVPKYYSLCCFGFYVLFYGILFSLALDSYKVKKVISDKLSLYTLCYYSLGKGLFFTVIINRDLPFYIDIFNSKLVSVIVTVFLLVSSILIWFRLYKIKNNKIIKRCQMELRVH